jgi:hypothetical protein
MTDTIKLPEPDISMFGIGDLYRADTVRRLIAEAVAVEREACAQIVDECVRMVDGADAVAAIRARNGSTT